MIFLDVCLSGWAEAQSDLPDTHLGETIGNVCRAQII